MAHRIPGGSAGWMVGILIGAVIAGAVAMPPTPAAAKEIVQLAAFNVRAVSADR